MQIILKGEEQLVRIGQRRFPFQWFHSGENQVTFLRNLRILNEFDYEIPSDLKTAEKREVAQNNCRSLTLFVFSGDERLINDLESLIRLREHDIIERWAPDELRGVLTHLREISPLSVEKIFQRFIKSEEMSKLKCLLLPIHSGKDLEDEVLSLINKALQEMSQGEMKTISI
jgi:hypothetical protein